MVIVPVVPFQVSVLWCPFSSEPITAGSPYSPQHATWLLQNPADQLSASRLTLPRRSNPSDTLLDVLNASPAFCASYSLLRSRILISCEISLILFTCPRYPPLLSVPLRSSLFCVFSALSPTSRVKGEADQLTPPAFENKK